MEAKVYQIPINTMPSDRSFTESYVPITPGSIPNDNFVISRDSNGNPVSLYSDMMWDFTSYDIRKRFIRIYFNNWSNDCNVGIGKLISNEIKHVFFILCWVAEISNKSVSTFRKYQEVLVNLAKFAYFKSISIFDVLKSELLIHEFLENCAGGVKTVFHRILYLLAQAGSEKIGFICCAPFQIKGFTKILNQYRESIKQHPPIPTRIYLELITLLKTKLSEYENNLEGIIRLAKKNLEYSYAGSTLSSASQAARKEGLAVISKPTANYRPGKKVILASELETTEKLVAKYSLGKFFSDRNLAYIKISINQIYMEIYSVCKMVIHLFTGMRNDEVTYLPYDCIYSSLNEGVKTFCIKGGTTKFGEKRVLWVTNEEAHRAVKIVQKIAMVIYGNLGIALPEDSHDVYKYPLFIKVSYAGLGGRKKRFSTNGAYTPVRLYEYKVLLDVTITEEDLQELEMIDPFRVWRDEDQFKINTKWNFTTHQFRRSLALYASSSGMVSLPSLKRQLKHISESMSLYYSKGSSFAKNILSLKSDHFVRDYQETAPISQALSYISEIIFSDERLFGPLGSNIEKKRSDFHIKNDRDKTISKFKKGEVAYVETFLGGCASTIPCEKKALRSIIACLNCSKAIIKKSKLETAIKAQENMIQNLSPASIEYKTENEDLLALRTAMLRFQEKE